jgi:predicted xylose isomerase-like sugar epimerase
VSPEKRLFSRSTEETQLGTAVIQLKDLLETNIIADDFPLLDKTRQHEFGGLARIAIRTGASFGETKEDTKEEQSPVANMGTTSGAATCIQPFAAYKLTKTA